MLKESSLKKSALKELPSKQHTLKNWPKAERPREKLVQLGSSSLSDAELLAIFLRTGVRGCNVVDLSRQLLSSFGSLGAIFSASKEDFCAKHGLGIAKYVQLQACLEMSKRYLAEKIEILVDKRTKSDESENSHVEIEQEIDQLVYDLYELTEEEIEIIENSNH